MEGMIGFIGCGKMGGCIVRGLCRVDAAAAARIVVCNHTPATTQSASAAYGVRGATAHELVTQCDMIVLGVKPYQVLGVLDDIRDAVVCERHLLVSLAAGVSLDVMARHLPPGAKIVRTMPNLPTCVNCGVTALCGNAHVTQHDLERVERLFAAIGKTFVVREQDMHAVTAVAGSAPAYAFLFADAMCDGAVLGGLPRHQAREMAVQTLLGAARMLEETTASPSQLKDDVCSPGGTTIEAVRSLERSGLRSAVIEAMVACMDKSRSVQRAIE